MDIVGSITLHRADMLKVLVDKFPEDENFRVHFSKKVKAYEKNAFNDYVTIFFEDGTRAKADILIGCDGIKSRIRGTIFNNLARKAGEGCPQEEKMKKHVAASWTGTFAYRSLVQTDKLLRESPDHRAARDTLCVSYLYFPWGLHADCKLTTVVRKEQGNVETLYMIRISSMWKIAHSFLSYLTRPTHQFDWIHHHFW